MVFIVGGTAVAVLAFFSVALIEIVAVLLRLGLAIHFFDLFIKTLFIIKLRFPLVATTEMVVARSRSAGGWLGRTVIIFVLALILFVTILALWRLETTAVILSRQWFIHFRNWSRRHIGLLWLAGLRWQFFGLQGANNLVKQLGQLRLVKLLAVGAQRQLHMRGTTELLCWSVLTSLHSRSEVMNRSIQIITDTRNTPRLRMHRRLVRLKALIVRNIDVWSYWCLGRGPRITKRGLRELVGSGQLIGIKSGTRLLDLRGNLLIITHQRQLLLVVSRGDWPLLLIESNSLGELLVCHGMMMRVCSHNEWVLLMTVCVLLLPIVWGDFLGSWVITNHIWVCEKINYN